jgi:hypothetical protein
MFEGKSCSHHGAFTNKRKQRAWMKAILLTPAHEFGAGSESFLLQLCIDLLRWTLESFAVFA